MRRTRLSMRSITSAVIVAMLHFAAPAMAMAQRPAVAGTVTDNAQHALAGVDVSIPEIGRATRSDAAGHFSFSDVPGGNYTVVFTLAGYETKTMTTNGAGSLDVALRPSVF